MADCDVLLKLNPKSGEAHCARGYFYKQQGAIDRAISECAEAIKLEPAFPNSYYMQLCYGLRRQPPKPPPT